MCHSSLPLTGCSVTQGQDLSHPWEHHIQRDGQGSFLDGTLTVCCHLLPDSLLVWACALSRVRAWLLFSLSQYPALTLWLPLQVILGRHKFRPKNWKKLAARQVAPPGSSGSQRPGELCSQSPLHPPLPTLRSCSVKDTICSRSLLNTLFKVSKHPVLRVAPHCLWRNVPQRSAPVRPTLSLPSDESGSALSCRPFQRLPASQPLLLPSSHLSMHPNPMSAIHRAPLVQQP